MSKYNVWKIENFSCLKGEPFLSPFCIFPGGYATRLSITQGHSEILVQPTSGNGGSTNCSITFLDSYGAPLIHKELTTHEGKRFVFPNEMKYFPNNTLRVKCCAWATNQCFSPKPDSKFVFTRVETNSKIVRKVFHPQIVRFRAMDPDSPFNIEETIWSDQSLNIKINFPNNGHVYLCFTASWFGFRAKIKVFALDTTEKMTEFGNCDASFTSKERSFTFKLNASRGMFLRHANKFLPSDTLSLVIDCTFSGHFATDRLVEGEGDIFSNMPTTDDVPTPAEVPKSEADETDTDSDEPGKEIEKSPPNTLSQSLQYILEEGYLSDFNLKVGERTFPVHKMVLGARSKVFRSLFVSEMKEMQDDCMDIKDIDVETLQRLLKFIYTGKINKDLDWAEASSLYAAADFYALDPLKQICSEILMDGLCATSALGVLSMADLHQDQQLKSAALDFISLNDEDIIGTEDWIKFEEDNGNLALKTFRELYSRKMNR